MKKQMLSKLRILKATKKMMKMAEEDIPKKISYWGRSEVRYKCGLYMRCQILDGILKAAFFFPEYMRMGANLPAYELFINKQTGEFLTYDRNKDKWLTAKLDMLSWPDYVRYSEKKWINPEGFQTIKRYLGMEHGGYQGILDYQIKVRADELKQRHRREIDPWDLDMEQTPELPKDWNRWIEKVGIPEYFIFYQYERKGAKTGYCTYCEKEVPIKNPHHNKQGTCPCCRHKIVFKSKGRSAYVVRTGSAVMYLLQRCEDGVMVREFEGTLLWKKREDYKIVESNVREVRRALFDKQGYALSAYYWGDYKHAEMRWIKTQLCSINYGYSYYYVPDYSGRVYGRTLPDLAKRELGRTGLMEYYAKCKCIDPERYLRIWESFQEIEKFAKAGLSALTKECEKNYSNVRDLCKNRLHSSLKKILGLDSQGFARLRKRNGDSKYLKWLQYEKESGKVIPDSDIMWFCEEDIMPEDLKFVYDRMSIVQIHNYVRRQMAENKMKSKEVLSTWSDYLSMAERLHMDTHDAIIYRVRKLRQRHDELVEQCRLKELNLQAEDVLKNYPHINQIYGKIKEKYEYADKEYSIVAPNCIEDILQEGQNLHHCLRGSDRYWERIERNESYIFFLRHSDRPEKSYYTLEIEPDGTVRQKRTMYDRQEADIEDATIFLRKWQREISRRLTHRERKLAKTSRILREKEFQEMRDKQLVIHTGELSGRLLVDVLTADLLENVQVFESERLQEAA